MAYCKTTSLLLAALVSLPAASHSLGITYFLTSNHLGDKLNTGEEYNDDHNFIGIEYRGVALASFTNSFYKQSFMLSYATYWQPYNNIEVSARIGGSTGYDGVDECLGGRGFAVCPGVSLGIAYTAYDLIVPKLSLMPGVVSLSFSARF